jgi:predicted glycosyl hydrolase (DUF1957 family)
VPVTNVNVKFAVQNTDSTPVYLFGNWNNWSNWPGTPMVFNSSTNTYEVTLPQIAGSTIEYLFVNGVGPTKEVLDPLWTCTNSNTTYTNRLSVIGNADTTLCNTWEECALCTPANIHELNEFELHIAINANGITIFSNQQQFDQIQVVDITGKRVYNSTETIYTNEKIDVQLNEHVLYFIQLKKGNQIKTLKSIF